MTLGKNIRYLRKKNDWSQDFLSEKLGYKSYTTIQKWEMGTSEPPLKKLKELADLFAIDIDVLAKEDLEQLKIQQEERSKYYRERLKAVRIPVLGRVQAGIPIDAQEEIVDWEEITPDMAITGEFFGLRINGDSMQPRMVEGDVVLVRQQSDAESGDVVIALVNGNEATIKKLIKYEDGGIALVAFNPLYQPMRFSEREIVEKPVAIIGKVVELRAKF